MSKQVQRGILSRLHATAAAAAVLALAACSGDAASPEARAPLSRGARLFSSGGSAHLVSNAVKYRDTGAPHATGRSGSATLEGSAVRGADGVTLLTITTGDLDDTRHAPGEIVKAQLKVFGPGGERLLVQNHNKLGGSGTQSFQLSDLPLGATIQVQANVRGIDGRRTDVVTLTARVVAAPALRVDVQVPPSVSVGVPTVINAVVTEINGDLGTRADCVLYVNGQPVDTAEGIWVDAGDAVTCVFTHTFDRAGNQTIEVRVDGASGESTLSPATDTATLDVVSGTSTTWSASVTDVFTSTTTVLDYTWSKPDGSHKEYSNTETTTAQNQSINLQGTLSRAAAFPLASVDLAVESGGGAWQVEHWTGLASSLNESGQACTSQQMSTQGAMFYLCNGLLGGASYGYTRFAGRVTYHSHGFSNTFDGLTATANNYAWNDTYTTSSSGGQIRPFGSQVKLTLTVADPLGSWTITPVVTLTPYTDPVVVTQPRSCEQSSPYWLDGGQLSLCNSASTQETGSRGTAGG